jgi:hypothetical protein
MEKSRRKRTINQKAGFHDLLRVPSHALENRFRASHWCPSARTRDGRQWQRYIGLSTSGYTIVEAKEK